VDAGQPKEVKMIVLRVSTLLIICSLFLGCSSDTDDGTGTDVSKVTTVTGETGKMGDSDIKTWAELDDKGAVTRVGFSAGAAGLDGLKAEAHLALKWSKEVLDQTFFNHLGLDFMHEGHGPQPYLHPHFDVHFYGAEVSVVGAIDCVKEPLPAGLTAGQPAADNEVVPDFYMIPGTGLEPDGSCVPKMGVHALDVRSGELQKDKPTPFTKTLILGYHAGALTFIEPMVTQAHFASRATWTWDIPQPKKLGRSVLWPSVLEATYDAGSGNYNIVFSKFTAVN
jgi:hypothetical protein